MWELSDTSILLVILLIQSKTFWLLSVEDTVYVTSQLIMQSLLNRKSEILVDHKLKILYVQSINNCLRYQIKRLKCLGWLCLHQVIPIFVSDAKKQRNTKKLVVDGFDGIAFKQKLKNDKLLKYIITVVWRKEKLCKTSITETYQGSSRITFQLDG